MPTDISKQNSLGCTMGNATLSLYQKKPSRNFNRNKILAQTKPCFSKNSFTDKYREKPQTPLKARLKSQAGFAFSFLLILMPFILSAFIALGLFFHLVNLKMKTHTECRRIFLNAQNQAAQSINKLMSLNPEALRLRLEYQSALKALQAAMISGNPQSIAAVKIWIEKIKIERLILDRLQKNLLTRENFLLNFAQMKAISEIQKTFSHAPTEIAFFKLLQNPQFKQHKLAVRPDRINDLAPLYELEPRFSERQALSISWRFQYSYGGAQWSPKWFSHTSNHSEQCSVSLRGSTQKLEAYISEDKFF